MTGKACSSLALFPVQLNDLVFWCGLTTTSASWWAAEGRPPSGAWDRTAGATRAWSTPGARPTPAEKVDIRTQTRIWDGGLWVVGGLSQFPVLSVFLNVKIGDSLTF